MLTKNIIQKIKKLNHYIDLNDYESQYRNLNHMKAVIRHSASKHELDVIDNEINRDAYGATNNVVDAREHLPLIVSDVYERYNATPEIKSMCFNTKKSAKLRRYFFLGNMIGSIQHQNRAYAYPGADAHNFHYYLGGGFVQADEDQEYLDLIKQGKANQTPNPADLINDSGAIMKNIRIGKKANRSPKWTKKMLKRTDAQVAN